MPSARPRGGPAPPAACGSTEMTSTMRRIAVLFALLLPAIASAEAPTADTMRLRPRHSWTSDRREFSAGDIITVLVDEQTLASANKGQSGVDETTRNNGLNAAVPSMLSTAVDVSFGTDKKSSSPQTANATPA